MSSEHNPKPRKSAYWLEQLRKLLKDKLGKKNQLPIRRYPRKVVRDIEYP